MANETVLVGCRLPHGIRLHHPLDPSVTVLIRGLNQSEIIGAQHVTTRVNAEFWDAWKATHEGKFAPLVSGGIFEAGDEREVKAIMRDLEKVKTGFEAMPQTHGEIKKVED